MLQESHVHFMGFLKSKHIQEHSIGSDSRMSFSLSQQLLLLKVKYQRRRSHQFECYTSQCGVILWNVAFVVASVLAQVVYLK